jgi:UDP-glucose 4-epimerase
MKVVVTGSSGYIGGQICLQLKDAGHEVHGIDCVPPPRHLSDVCDSVTLADYASNHALGRLVSLQPDAVVHCAATSLVGPSIKDPSTYYNNNVVKFVKLVDILKQALPRVRFVFSSSAATYGQPENSVCTEQDRVHPISAYGASKLIAEHILEHYNWAYGFNYVAFRYFNACGADSRGRHGQAPGASHIIARVLESLRDNQEFVLYGTDYDTADGTCVRDYVHVEDIARAHVMAVSSMPGAPGSFNIMPGVYNLGSGCGVSNQKIIDTAQAIVGQQLRLTTGPRRPGDPATLIADSSWFDAESQQPWRQHSLDSIIQTAWNWYVRSNQKI